TTQTIEIPPGTQIFISFQWEDPFKTVSVSSTGATRDFDVELYYQNTNTVMSSTLIGDLTPTEASGEVSNIGGNPYEEVEFYNSTAGTVYADLRIALYAGSGTPRLKYVLYNVAGVTPATINDHQTYSGTSYGHANAAGAIAVGAARYTN